MNRLGELPLVASAGARSQRLRCDRESVAETIVVGQVEHGRDADEDDIGHRQTLPGADAAHPWLESASPGMVRAMVQGQKERAMAETTEFTIGAEASCTDGDCGKVSRVVIDPLARTVTHLVVEPKHRQGLGRLVPLDLVDATTGEIRLRCTLAEFERLDSAEETQFIPGSSGYAAYGPGQVLSWPYYGLGGGTSMVGGMQVEVPGFSQTVTYDKIPIGEVEVRRGEHVHATDGDIGRVQGLVIDPRDHHVTHVLLQEGHLWGRKDVAIPIRAVTGVDDGIQLSITRQEVQDLPPVDIAHPNG
jgi:sporulation protein YlmC with PRC-barrel domain